MAGQTDDIKGRVKEAVGTATDDRSLEAEGKADRAAGKVKNVAERTEEKVEDAIDSVKEKLQQLTWLGGGRVARKGVPGLLAPRVAGEGLVGSP